MCVCVWESEFGLRNSSCTQTQTFVIHHLYSLLPTSTCKIQRLSFDVLHILPTLVNIQGDDQLNWANQTPSILGAENDCPHFSVPTWSQLLDPPPFPHVAWSHLLLQEDNVSNAASRFSAAWLSNLVVCPEFQQVFFCPTLPKVLGDLLLESEFLRQTFGRSRFRSGRDGS